MVIPPVAKKSRCSQMSLLMPGRTACMRIGSSSTITATAARMAMPLTRSANSQVRHSLVRLLAEVASVSASFGRAFASGRGVSPGAGSSACPHQQLQQGSRHFSTHGWSLVLTMCGNHNPWWPGTDGFP